MHSLEVLVAGNIHSIAIEVAIVVGAGESSDMDMICG